MSLDLIAAPANGPGALAGLVVVLLVQDGDRVDWWRKRLAASVGEVAVGAAGERPLQLYLLPWTSALPEAPDEIHVLGADTLPATVLHGLRQRGGLLSLHRWGESAGACDVSRWASESDLACYMEQLLRNLGGRAFFGLRWLDYRQHRGQPGSCVGRNVRGGDWRELLAALAALADLPGTVTSAIVFLNVGPAFTLGDYVELCGVLDRLLPSRCLTTVSVVAGMVQEYSATFLLTTLELDV